MRWSRRRQAQAHELGIDSSWCVGDSDASCAAGLESYDPVQVDFGIFLAAARGGRLHAKNTTAISREHAMLVEGDIEIRIGDKAALGLDDHETKLWIQRAFRDRSCYRISNFYRQDERTVRANVAIKFSDLPESERSLIESRPNDVGLLRSFIEKMFEGKGTLRALGDPQLRTS